MIDPGRGGQTLPIHDDRSRLSELLPVYFPATVPVLGSELSPPPAVRDAIWSDLAAHANEIFFAPLSTRLSSGNLNRRLRQRLDAHIATRSSLMGDLRKALESPGTDPLARAVAIGELSRTHDAAIAALSASSDELRREFYRGGFLSGNADWNAHRNWRLDASASNRSAQELLYDEMSVMRAAAYYQEGLSLGQRRLLFEIVIEIASALGAREASTLSDSFEPEQIVFFLPHGSRIRVPHSASAGLLAQIAEFTAEKDSLKRELRDALFQLDRESSGRREKSLQELAARQAPRFAALEPQAERIRAAMSELPETRQSAAADGLSETLARRIDAYLREKAELQGAARRQAETASKPGNSTRTAPTREALAAFEEQNRTRLAALSIEARSIREEVARAAAARGDSAAKSVDALLADFMSAFKHQQLLSLYRDYRTAVLEPGLSPLQRQLLFDAAVASLDLTGTKDWQAVPE